MVRSISPDPFPWRWRAAYACEQRVVTEYKDHRGVVVLFEIAPSTSGHSIPEVKATAAVSRRRQNISNDTRLSLSSMTGSQASKDTQ